MSITWYCPTRVEMPVVPPSGTSSCPWGHSRASPWWTSFIKLDGATELSTKMFLTTEVSAGTEAQTGGQKKKVWKFSINYSSRTFMKRLVLIWAGMTSLLPNTTYNPSHSATATSDMRGQAGTEREPARISSVKLSQNINWPTDCTASASAELHWTTTGDS